MKKFFKKMDPDDIFILLGFCCMGMAACSWFGWAILMFLSNTLNISNDDLGWVLLIFFCTLWIICWLLAAIIKFTRGKKK